MRGQVHRKSSRAYRRLYAKFEETGIWTCIYGCGKTFSDQDGLKSQCQRPSESYGEEHKRLLRLDGWFDKDFREDAQLPHITRYGLAVDRKKAGYTYHPEMPAGKYAKLPNSERKILLGAPIDFDKLAATPGIQLGQGFMPLSASGRIQVGQGLQKLPPGGGDTMRIRDFTPLIWPLFQLRKRMRSTVTSDFYFTVTIRALQVAKLDTA